MWISFSSHKNQTLPLQRKWTSAGDIHSSSSSITRTLIKRACFWHFQFRALEKTTTFYVSSYNIQHRKRERESGREKKEQNSACQCCVLEWFVIFECQTTMKLATLLMEWTVKMSQHIHIPLLFIRIIFHIFQDHFSFEFLWISVFFFSHWLAYFNFLLLWFLPFSYWIESAFNTKWWHRYAI